MFLWMPLRVVFWGRECGPELALAVDLGRRGGNSFLQVAVLESMHGVSL